ncbi:MAG: sulfite exporter TauE/SafE family protein [Candidatus Celaenobacter antarcticus]|nr:sulfite exporter TauE/SafE family protein [Candidatus Celaenobacter antarcticus]
MVRIILTSIAILAIAVIMAMTGRGGGNFYVPLLVASGQPMHEAATSGQFILVFAAMTAMFVFHKQKMVDWKLALVIDPPTDIMAFVGGYFSGLASGVALKFLLAALLTLAGFLMLLKVRNRPIGQHSRIGFWHRNFGNEEYVVNLWLAIPITAVTGLAAGAVGISGGSFKVPLMVLLCGVPMHVAVGTSSAMVAATALMGFFGHSSAGHFDYRWAIPVACVAALGSFLGGKLTLKTKPKTLKTIFALTTLAAAVFMTINAFLSE